MGVNLYDFIYFSNDISKRKTAMPYRQTNINGVVFQISNAYLEVVRLQGIFSPITFSRDFFLYVMINLYLLKQGYWLWNSYLIRGKCYIKKIDSFEVHSNPSKCMIYH